MMHSRKQLTPQLFIAALLLCSISTHAAEKSALDNNLYTLIKQHGLSGTPLLKKPTAEIRSAMAQCIVYVF